ncbi:importin subunit alpha [Anaeramoeba flamelloides]|uniref:Importin subunit alpha n=1 Tax=Anaeramoeba flamelloides TaxID=1746091 RepID=A0AAV7Z5T1_9EUKA|nr:importin subunit alpha [Anaeramoeba flamelloides]
MNFEKKLEKRKKKFKTKLTRHESTNKRKNIMLSISKKKKEDLIRKKRNITITEEDSDEYYQLVQEILQRLPEIYQQLSNPNCSNTLELVTDLRKMVCGKKDPPIDELIESNCVGYLIDFLGDNNNPNLQCESAWVLSNIASGNETQTRFLVENQAIPAFIKLLNSPDENVLDQSIWALGNIAGDCVEYRDELLKLGVFDKFLEIIQTTTTKSIILNLIWALSNCVRKTPYPPLTITKYAFPIYYKLIQHDDYDIKIKGFWGLNYLSNGEYDNIQLLIDTDILPIILENLQKKIPEIRIPSLRILGNVTSGNEEHTQTFIDEGGILVLKHYFNHGNPQYRKEACWTISNVCAGTVSQIYEVIENDYVSDLIEIITNDHPSIKKEACFALTNIINCGDVSQLNILLSKHIIKPLCSLLDSIDNEIDHLVLTAIEQILHQDINSNYYSEYNNEEESSYAKLIENVGGKKKIEILSYSKDTLISTKANTILYNFFNDEEDYESDSD